MRLSVAELARPLLEEILTSGDTDWFRIAIYPSTAGASYAKTRLVKAHSDKEWEFRAAKNPDTEQSAVYARWLGTNTAP